MERGDTGLGRDAYGLPRRERDRRGYGRGPNPADGYPASADYEEVDAAGPGRPVDVEDDDYGQLLRRPGDSPPRQRLSQPARPYPGQPGRFPPGTPPNPGPGPGGGPVPGHQYRLPNGRRVPPGADRLYRPPGPSVPAGTSGRHHAPGPAAAQDSYAGSGSRPGPVPGGPARGEPQPYGGPGASGSPPLREHPPAGPRFDSPDGRDRLGPAPEPPGPVIRQREAAVPDQPSGSAQPVASIAPDGLEAFARDLRALRAQADLDYPEMAEVSHYEMKTLAAAAGGLRLPSLPVAVAFVRACNGNVTEWEERWQKLAEKLTAEAAKKRKSDGEESAAPVEPADAPAALEPQARTPATPPTPDSDGDEVYVITSAKPRQPGW